MVEIALAMVVISLGITGILGLFSVGVNAKKAAINENNVADAAEYVLGVYKAFVCNKYESGESITLDSLGLKGALSNDDSATALNVTDWDANTALSSETSSFASFLPGILSIFTSEDLNVLITALSSSPSFTFISPARGLVSVTTPTPSLVFTIAF